MATAPLRIATAVKQRLDETSDLNGGLTQSRMIAALLNGWAMLTDDQQRDAIRATATGDESDAEADRAPARQCA